MAQKGSSKKSKSSNKAPVAGAPGWVWLATGLAIGLFVAFLVYLQGRPERDDLAKMVPHQQQEGADSAKTDKDQPRFEFYTLLPEMEVVVPEAPHKAPAAGDDHHRQQAAPTEPGSYALQVGSFRTHRDADTRKASLALLGVESEIQKVKLNDNETWHRVRVGPYSDLDELNRVRALLQDNHIDTLLVRIREKS